jgi:hypothetical protein
MSVFKEYQRPSFKDRLNRANYRLKIGDRVRMRSDGSRGVVVGRQTFSEVVSMLTEAEAKRLIERMANEYDDPSQYLRYNLRIKDLILDVEASDIEPDTFEDERTVDEQKQVEAPREPNTNEASRRR